MPKPATGWPSWHGHHRAIPKEIGEFALRRPEKGAHAKMVSAIAGTNAPDRFRQFEKFLASAGVDPNSQVEELALGP